MAKVCKRCKYREVVLLADKSDFEKIEKMKKKGIHVLERIEKSSLIRHINSKDGLTSTIDWPLKETEYCYYCTAIKKGHIKQ